LENHSAHAGAKAGEFLIVRKKSQAMANTKALSHEERKTAKRTARKSAAPKAARTTPRGSNKKKMKSLSKGQSKR
jgi:hypothetical protein